MLSEICSFRVTWLLFIVFLVSYLSYPLRGQGAFVADFANKFIQFSALLAMSLRWSSQLASKVSEGNCTKGMKRRTALPFLMLERPDV
jgi:hypothetical protein